MSFFNHVLDHKVYKFNIYFSLSLPFADHHYIFGFIGPKKPCWGSGQLTKEMFYLFFLLRFSMMALYFLGFSKITKKGKQIFKAHC